MSCLSARAAEIGLPLAMEEGAPGETHDHYFSENK
jgi:hypothetical protein